MAVAASDSVGRLPDQNIAQATGRLPGVAVERDQGQARYISLRGAPNYWTTLSFDGINVVSPEGRDARFDTIPSSIASQIVVSKAVTPDMPGETVSGNVNIITRSALDYDGFHFAGKLGGGQAVLGGRAEHRSVGRGVRRLPDRPWHARGAGLGQLLPAQHDHRQFRDRLGTGDPGHRVPASATRFWAREFENKLYRLMRRNMSTVRPAGLGGQ